MKKFRAKLNISKTTPATGWMLFMSLLLAALVSGCAGTARGTTNTVYKEKTTKSATITIPQRSEALVVIRYPAIISAEAEHPFYQAFGNSAIGGVVPINVKVRTDTTRVAQAVIAKTNFYAMTLFNELQKLLPENAVLLSPHMIAWNRENGLHSRPMLASEQVPSVLTIDFSVYSYPDIRKIMDSEPLTFGDIVTPLVVVHSNRWLRPSTHGLLLASEPLLETSWSLSSEQAKEQFNSMLEYPRSNPQRTLDFIRFINTRYADPIRVPQKAPGESRNSVLAVESYPVEKVLMNPDLVMNFADGSANDPFAESFVKGAAGRILSLLASIDQDRALFFTRQNALQKFDPELANVIMSADQDESVRARLQLAEALIEAEKIFLAGQSQSVFEGTYYGDYGQKMRQMIVAEFGMLEERRRLARIQNVTTALTVAMLAGSVYGTSVSGSVIASALQNITGVLVLGSIWAINKNLNTRAKSGNITEKFMALMAPDLDRQIAVQMEWLESREIITARGFAEFRDKTTALYQARVRSLSTTVEDYCGFSHPAIGVGAMGRWYGECLDGKATARGYGLTRDDAGNSVEYLGEASMGEASGVGGMIVRRSGQSGVIFYEGEFSNGLPHGVVEVGKPGQKPALRRFEAGKDVGKAMENQWQRLEF